MIRIYRVALLFIQLIAQLSLKLVARKAKHWQHEAEVNFSRGIKVFIAALVSWINRDAVEANKFLSYARGLKEHMRSRNF